MKATRLLANASQVVDNKVEILGRDRRRFRPSKVESPVRIGLE
jgi:hypothetical protein